MSKEKNPKSLVTDQAVDYAYGVFDAVINAINTVAEHPERLPQLAIELTQKTPEIFDAFMSITAPEHRLVVYNLFKAAGGLIKACSQKKKKG